jgi:HK97 gp10 family phage protein
MSETHGFTALEQTFKNFQFKDKRQILLSAFRKATKPTIDAAKANVPVGPTGNLNRSIGLVPIRDNIGVHIGARIRGGWRGYHGYIVEHGTRNRRYQTKNGKIHFTGHMTRTNFMKKAAESTEKQVIDTVAQEWYGAIQRFIIRNDRKDN